MCSLARAFPPLSCRQVVSLLLAWAAQESAHDDDSESGEPSYAAPLLGARRGSEVAAPRAARLGLFPRLFTPSPATIPGKRQWLFPHPPRQRMTAKTRRSFASSASRGLSIRQGLWDCGASEAGAQTPTRDAGGHARSGSRPAPAVEGTEHPWWLPSP